MIADPPLTSRTIPSRTFANPYLLPSPSSQSRLTIPALQSQTIEKPTRCSTEERRTTLSPLNQNPDERTGARHHVSFNDEPHVECSCSGGCRRSETRLIGNLNLTCPDRTCSWSNNKFTSDTHRDTSQTSWPCPTSLSLSVRVSLWLPRALITVRKVRQNVLNETRPAFRRRRRRRRLVIAVLFPPPFFPCGIGG
jgi:hypothetical protein